MADDTAYVTELQQEATQQQLWKKIEWLNLMHYDVSGDDYYSQVDDSNFFNADDGKTNPEAELLATIAAFFSGSDTSDQHALCRLTARFAWLQETLSIDLARLPAVQCNEYREWRSMVRAKSVTMIFPAYHLNSPSSMFGHTLLRLDPSAEGEWSDWLSFAVNFGADINDQDNSLFFAFKGLTGGYRGIFIVEPYFKKIQEYNRIENRDIWEYQLNLTPEETERMILHLWELKEINFDYYFFDENCSYRLLELLEVARPGIELTEGFDYTAIPVDTVRSIERAGLIQKIEYRPSEATAIQQLLDKLPEQDQVLVKQLSEDITLAESDRFSSRPEDNQRLMIETAYKYIQYQYRDEQRDPATAKRAYQLLELLNAYPAQQSAVSNETELVPPENSHLSRRAGFGAGERFDKSYAEFSMKMSFHDLEDNEHGFLRGAQINLGEIRARIDEEGTVRLHQLDMVNIFSLTNRTPFFTPLSWRIATGLDRQMTNGRDRLTAHVTGGAGVSYELFSNNMTYALAMLRLEHNNGFEDNVEHAFGFSTGMLQHFGSNTAHLELSGEEFSDDIYRLRADYKHNFVIARNHSVKFTARREWQKVDRFNEISLNYLYYFY